MAWPDIQAPSSITERKKKAQIRSDFEAGYVQSRAQWTRSRKIFELSWANMTNSDKETLETYFDNNLGSTFSWTHPYTDTTYTVRFAEDQISAEYIHVGYWNVEVILEEQ